MTGILDRIDDTLGYVTRDTLSSDAMRWQPERPAQVQDPQVPQLSPEAVQAIRLALTSVADRIKQVAEIAARVMPHLQAFTEAGTRRATSEPDHPLLRMAARRENLTHGPQRPARPPRQLGPR